MIRPALAGLAALAIGCPPPTQPEHRAEPAAARSAEEVFFDALNRRPERRAEAVAALAAWASREPGAARPNLLLGLAHLWAASERSEVDALAIEDLVLAEHFLARAAALDPKDSRITSWLQPARYYRAQTEGDAAAMAAALDALRAAARESPCFHSVALAIIRFDSPPESPEFKEALEAMRAAAACAPDDRAVLNRPRWPHNVEGFSVAWADFERKAGNEARAREILTATELIPSYEQWPFKHLTTDRLDPPGGAPAAQPLRFALANRAGSSCLACHQGP